MELMVQVQLRRIFDSICGRLDLWRTQYSIFHWPAPCTTCGIHFHDARLRADSSRLPIPFLAPGIRQSRERSNGFHPCSPSARCSFSGATTATFDTNLVRARHRCRSKSRIVHQELDCPHISSIPEPLLGQTIGSTQAMQFQRWRPAALTGPFSSRSSSESSFSFFEFRQVDEPFGDRIQLCGSRQESPYTQFRAYIVSFLRAKLHLSRHTSQRTSLLCQLPGIADDPILETD